MTSSSSSSSSSSNSLSTSNENISLQVGIPPIPSSRVITLSSSNMIDSYNKENIDKEQGKKSNKIVDQSMHDFDINKNMKQSKSFLQHSIKEENEFIHPGSLKFTLRNRDSNSISKSINKVSTIRARIRESNKDKQRMFSTSSLSSSSQPLKKHNHRIALTGNTSSSSNFRQHINHQNVKPKRIITKRNRILRYGETIDSLFCLNISDRIDKNDEHSCPESHRALCNEIVSGLKMDDAEAWNIALAYASKQFREGDGKNFFHTKLAQLYLFICFVQVFLEINFAMIKLCRIFSKILTNTRLEPIIYALFLFNQCVITDGQNLIRLHRRAISSLDHPKTTNSPVKDVTSNYLLSIYLSYARAQSLFSIKNDARQTYNYILNKRIGECESILYISIADFEIKEGNLEAAKEALFKGLSKNAKPAENIKEKLKYIALQTNLHSNEPIVDKGIRFEGNDDSGSDKQRIIIEKIEEKKSPIFHVPPLPSYRASKNDTSDKSFRNSPISLSKVPMFTSLGNNNENKNLNDKKQLAVILKMNKKKSNDDGKLDVNHKSFVDYDEDDLDNEISFTSTSQQAQSKSKFNMNEDDDVTIPISDEPVCSITSKCKKKIDEISALTTSNEHRNDINASKNIEVGANIDSIKPSSSISNSDSQNEIIAIKNERISNMAFDSKIEGKQLRNRYEKKPMTLIENFDSTKQLKPTKSPAKCKSKVSLGADSQFPTETRKRISCLLSKNKKTLLSRSKRSGILGSAQRVSAINVADSFSADSDEIVSLDSTSKDLEKRRKRLNSFSKPVPKITRTDLSYMLNWEPGKERKSSSLSSEIVTKVEGRPMDIGQPMEKIEEESLSDVLSTIGGGHSNTTQTNSSSYTNANNEIEISAEKSQGMNSGDSQDPIENRCHEKERSPLEMKSSENKTIISSQSPQESDILAKANMEFLPLVSEDNILFVNSIPYAKLGVIGKGGSCKVYRALSKDCAVLAIKKVKLDGMDEKAIKGYANEIALLKKLRGNPAIIQMYDSEVDLERKSIFLVMELGEVDLNYVLQQQCKLQQKNQGRSEPFKPRLNMNFIRLTWQQMLSAVHCIHEERIIHSDLKPANFLFVRGALKLIDFGIAKAIQSEDTTNIYRDSQIGTLNYMSPEAILDTNSGGDKARMRLGRASDIWSLGCILYQMVYGRTPFAELHMIQKLQAIINPEHKIIYPEISEKSAVDAIKLCLQRDASKRPPIVGRKGLLNEHCFLHSFTQK